MSSGITGGRVLNGELYAQGFHKLLDMNIIIYHIPISGISQQVLLIHIFKGD